MKTKIKHAVMTMIAVIDESAENRQASLTDECH